MNTYTFDEINIGMTESFQVEITEEKHRLFTELSGDCNPMHMDSDFAIENGFRDKIVYGMVQASFLSTLVGVYLPGKYCLFETVDALYFKKPVYIGDVLTVSGKVIGKVDISEEGPQRGTVSIKADIRNQNGEKVSLGKLTVGVMK